VVLLGRVKTSVIKNIASRIYEENKDKFTDDFNKNKEIVNTLLKIHSKRLRNILVGYITSLKKREYLQQG
jgi:small subunit ribosomal protein S17e